MCLAASVARGRDPEEDRRLAEGLLRSEKERREHRLVLNMIRGELGPLSDELQHPEEPTILRLGNVQHLHTPVRARLREGITVFDVLERLHPTPAVGGTPRDLAMAFIRQHEGFHRGWYASPVGWVDWREEGSSPWRCGRLWSTAGGRRFLPVAASCLIPIRRRSMRSLV